MKSLQRVLTLLAVVLALTAQGSNVFAQTPALDTEEKKILYAIGLAVGQQIGQFSLTADELALVQQGFADAALKREPQVNLMEYGPKLQGFAQERIGKAAAGEKAASAEYVDKLAAEEGSVRTDSGLVYKEITAGTGASPTATDTVSVHYHGTLRDGTVFDSSKDRGQPATFALNRVIKCWTEGLQMMKVGGKSRLVCPSDIAYGDQGRPGIPGGATLVFEVELLEIQAPPPEPGGP